MNLVSVFVVYMLFVDVVFLIVVYEMGFVQVEGVSFDLIVVLLWLFVCDMLVFGCVDVVYLLLFVLIVMVFGLGGVLMVVFVVLVLFVNGNVIGVGQDIEV